MPTAPQPKRLTRRLSRYIPVLAALGYFCGMILQRSNWSEAPSWLRFFQYCGWGIRFLVPLGILGVGLLVWIGLRDPSKPMSKTGVPLIVPSLAVLWGAYFQLTKFWFYPSCFRTLRVSAEISAEALGNGVAFTLLASALLGAAALQPCLRNWPTAVAVGSSRARWGWAGAALLLVGGVALIGGAETTVAGALGCGIGVVGLSRIGLSAPSLDPRASTDRARALFWCAAYAEGSVVCSFMALRWLAYRSVLAALGGESVDPSKQVDYAKAALAELSTVQWTYPAFLVLLLLVAAKEIAPVATTLYGSLGGPWRIGRGGAVWIMAGAMGLLNLEIQLKFHLKWLDLVRDPWALSEEPCPPARTAENSGGSWTFILAPGTRGDQLHCLLRVTQPEIPQPAAYDATRTIYFAEAAAPLLPAPFDRFLGIPNGTSLRLACITNAEGIQFKAAGRLRLGESHWDYSGSEPTDPERRIEGTRGERTAQLRRALGRSAPIALFFDDAVRAEEVTALVHAIPEAQWVVEQNCGKKPD